MISSRILIRGLLILAALALLVLVFSHGSKSQPTEDNTERDSQRMENILKLKGLLSLAPKETLLTVPSKIVYLSLPDNSSTCNSYSLPSLPNNWSYRCQSAAHFRALDGTGWLPLNLTTLPQGTIFDQLPIDPRNQATDGQYYAFVTDWSGWILTSKFESALYTQEESQRDNGVDDSRWEVGSNPTLWAQALGLLDYFPFDEGHGQETIDRITHQPATLHNDPIWTTGKHGQALKFDGQDDFIDAGSLDHLQHLTSFTVSAWVKPNSFRQGGIVTYGRSIETFGLAVYPAPSRISFETNWPAKWFQLSTEPPLSIDRWYHVVSVFDYSKTKVGNAWIFLNGKLERSATWSLTTVPVNPDSILAIGVNQPGDLEFFDGIIDDVRIYNRSLNEQEVQAMYQAGQD